MTPSRGAGSAGDPSSGAPSGATPSGATPSGAARSAGEVPREVRRRDLRFRDDADLAEVTQFEVRRRASLYVAAVLVPALLAGLLGWLAWDGRDVVVAAMAVVLALTALAALPGLRDLRTPLFVADVHGVRMRSGRLWVGLLWSEMAGIHVEGRSGRHDPCIKVVSPDGSRVFRSPIGVTTNVSVGEAEVQLARVLEAVAY